MLFRSALFYDKGHKTKNTEDRDSQYNLNKTVYKNNEYVNTRLTSNNNSNNNNFIINNEANKPIKKRKEEESKFTLSFAINHYLFIFNMSAISALNYLGFALIIILSYFLQNKEDCITNIIVYNIMIISIIICYSYSNTLTNYISNESFHHSHSNKHRYTKICCFTLDRKSVV